MQLSGDGRTVTSTRNGWQHASLQKGFGGAGCGRWRWMVRRATGTECILFGVATRPTSSNPLKVVGKQGDWWTIDARDGALRARGEGAAACRALGGGSAGWGSTTDQPYVVEMGLDCARGELSLVVGETNYGVVFEGAALRGGRSAPQEILWPTIAVCERGAAVELVSIEWFDGAATLPPPVAWPAASRGQHLASRPAPPAAAPEAVAPAPMAPRAARSTLRSQAQLNVSLEAQLLEASFSVGVARKKAAEALVARDASAAEGEAQRQRAETAEAALAALAAEAAQHRRGVERELKATLADEIGRNAAVAIAKVRRDAARAEQEWGKERNETVALTEKLVNAAEARIAKVERAAAVANERAAAADARLAGRMSTEWFMQLVIDATSDEAAAASGGGSDKEECGLNTQHSGAVRDDVLQSWSAETSRDADARVEMRVAASVRRAIQQAIAARREAERAKREAAAARRETRLADADKAAAQTRVEELHAQLLAANRAATTMRTEGERARASLVEVVAAERSASSELEIMRASLTRAEERLTTLLATSSEDAAHVEALAFELSATRAHLAAAKKRLHDFETVRTDADEASRREDALRAELEAERAQTARHERRSRAELETERVALEEKEECIRSSAAELETARAALHRVRAESAQHAEAMSAAAVRLSVERQGELEKMVKTREREADEARRETKRAQRQLRSFAHGASLAHAALSLTKENEPPQAAGRSRATSSVSVSLPARAMVLSDTSTTVRVQLVPDEYGSNRAQASVVLD